MNSTTLRDHQFKNVSFQLSEMKHHYGSQLHLLSDPYLLSLLAKLCSSETTQPVINELIHSIYTSLLNTSDKNRRVRKPTQSVYISFCRYSN